MTDMTPVKFMTRPGRSTRCRRSRRSTPRSPRTRHDGARPHREAGPCGGGCQPELANAFCSELERLPADSSAAGVRLLPATPTAAAAERSSSLRRWDQSKGMWRRCGPSLAARLHTTAADPGQGRRERQERDGLPGRGRRRRRPGCLSQLPVIFKQPCRRRRHCCLRSFHRSRITRAAARQPARSHPRLAAPLARGWRPHETIVMENVARAPAAVARRARPRGSRSHQGHPAVRPRAIQACSASCVASAVCMPRARFRRGYPNLATNIAFLSARRFVDYSYLLRPSSPTARRRGPASRCAVASILHCGRRRRRRRRHAARPRLAAAGGTSAAAGSPGDDEGAEGEPCATRRSPRARRAQSGAAAPGRSSRRRGS